MDDDKDLRLDDDFVDEPTLDDMDEEEAEYNEELLSNK